jgi:branched-chain amino acid transport system substrate-binding protein
MTLRRPVTSLAVWSRALTAHHRVDLAVVGVLALLVAACGQGSSAGTDHSPYPIGFLPDSSGGGAVNGIAMENGGNLAVAEINAAGGVNGHPLQVYDKDTQVQPALAVSELQSMITINHVQVVISQGSTVIRALSPIAGRNHVVLINHAGVDPTLANPANYTLSTIANSNQEMQVMATYIVNELPKAKKLAILADTVGGQNEAASLTSDLEAHGVQVVANEKFTFGDVDYHSQLLRIQATNPDAIFTTNFAQGGANMFKQSVQLGIHSQWLANTFFPGGTLALAGDAVNGVIFTNDVFDPTSSTKAAAFAAAFQAKYNMAPIIYAATAYDSVYLVAKALASVGNDGTKILNYLLGLTGFVGVLGPMSMDKKGQVAMPISVQAVLNGNIVTLRSSTAA